MVLKAYTERKWTAIAVFNYLIDMLVICCLDFESTKLNGDKGYKVQNQLII